MVVKLHGDFQSSRLKNTSDELKKLDAQLSSSLVEACKRYGLAIVGYSGRDHSIMDTLEAAVSGDGSFPAGLFWFHHSGAPLLDRVSKLIEKASAKGIDAHLIELETFDELMSDLLLLTPTLPEEIETYLNQQPRRVSDAQIPTIEGTWPIVRTNALKILSWPITCRSVVCEIGGTKEVKEAIKESAADVIGTRGKVGVLAFGRDVEVRKAFAKYKIVEFDIYSIAERRLYFDSQELGLLYEAFAHALQHASPVRVERRWHRYVLVVDDNRVDDPSYSALKGAVGRITGVIPGTNLHWAEAASFRLEFRLGRMWLLVEPTIWLDYSDDEVELVKGKEFVRERLATRYNRSWNSVLRGWIGLIVGERDQREVCAFGIDDGMDATFLISSGTAFSNKANRV